MINNEILKLLPKIKELNSVRLPSSITFSLEKKYLSIMLSDATGNMQENKSAFVKCRWNQKIDHFNF